MSTSMLGLISAMTALIASILGPIVTLTVARRQFNANVISTNRQKWIETFRDRLSELVSLISTASLVRSEWRSQWNARESISKDPLFVTAVEKITYSFTQLTLLTNEEEDSHQTLLRAIDRAITHLQNAEASEGDVRNDMDELRHVGRQIIRYEWGRVKRGV